MAKYIQQRSTNHLLCAKHFHSHSIAEHNHYMHMSLENFYKAEIEQKSPCVWWGEVERGELHCYVT